MKQKILVSILTVLLISTNGVVIFFIYKAGVSYRNTKINELKAYPEGEKTLSTYLQLELLQPSKEQEEEIIRFLAERRYYQTAENLGNTFGINNLYEILAQRAYLNADYKVGKAYAEKVTDTAIRGELATFDKWVTSVSYKYQSTINPKTETAKFALAIENGTFSSLNSNTFLTNKLTDIQDGTIGNNQRYLTAAYFLTDQKVYYPALRLLNLVSGCNTDKYIQTANIYEELGDNDSALESINDGLECDSTNPDLLRKAIYYTDQMSDTSQSNYYQQRIEILNDIKK